MRLDQVKKEAEIWLRNQLAEYEAYGEIQAKQANEAFTRETLGKFVDPRYVEKLPMPALQLAKIIQQYWPKEKAAAMGINIPPGAEAELANAVASMTGLGSARQTLESFPAEQIAPIVRAFGEKPVLDVLNQIRSEKEKAAEREIRIRELAEAVESRKLRGEELGVRQQEVKGGGQPKRTELQTDLERKEAERQKYVDIFWGTGRSWQENAIKKTPKDVKILTNKILDVTDEIKDLKNKLGVQANPKYKRAADTLKSQGLTPEDLLVNKPFRNQRTGETKGIRDLIIEDGYDIFKILEYMK